jgi:hypothetical protein
MRQDRQFSKILNLDTRNAPISAVYLAREVQRLKYQIKSMEDVLRDYPEMIEKCQNELTVLEQVLARHPCGPDLSNLKPSRRNRERTLPYGQMAKTVCEFLKQKNEPVATFSITMHVVKKAGLELGRQDYIQFNKQVLRSLNYLKKRGEVERVTAPGKIGWRTEVSWQLA